MVCNGSRVVWKYIRHLEICDISDNSDCSDSSDSRQEQICLQDFATFCISNWHYSQLVGPCVCAVLALVLNIMRSLYFVPQPVSLITILDFFFYS